MRLVLATLCCALALPAQTGELTPDWEMRQILDSIAAHCKKMLPILEQADPKDWTNRGAPDTYVRQWEGARAQGRAIMADAIKLGRAPDKLSAELELLFRLQGMDAYITSLLEGIRRYQNPALAELLLAVNAENGGNRDRLQQYVVELAAQREQEFRVADQEAQRCRASLAKQPGGAAPKPTEKK